MYLASISLILAILSGSGIPLLLVFSDLDDNDFQFGCLFWVASIILSVFAARRSHQFSKTTRSDLGSTLIALSIVNVIAITCIGFIAVALRFLNDIRAW